MAVKFIKNEQRQQAHDGLHLSVTGQMVIGLLFLVALIAFEIFNFDTTQYALETFLGQASFAGLGWATVLAIAFCAIDFAGLVRFFLPEEKSAETPVEVWYLMGAWLLGATMNALMTWWAVSLTLLNHDLGNEILSRQQILEIVPIFVAVLVWLTRILFIGAFTVAGGYLFDFNQLRRLRNSETARMRQLPARPVTAQKQPRRERPQRQPVMARPRQVPAGLRPVITEEGELGAGKKEDARPRSKRPAISRPQAMPMAAQAASRHERA